MSARLITRYAILDKAVKPSQTISYQKTEREALEKVRELYEQHPKGKWDFNREDYIAF